MKTFLLVLSCTLFVQTSFAQKYPFPQNLKYPHGYWSYAISNTDVAVDYEKWKALCVRECGSTEARVIKYVDGVETTVSEGIAYGMAIVVYMGDKVLFDKLLNYYMARLNERGLMNWIYENCDTGNNKKNGATDADLDVAYALVVATKQWPKEKLYKEQASRLIDALQKHNFTDCEGLLVQKPGDDFGGCTCTNPSYYAPGYYRVFARFKQEQGNKTAEAFWLRAATDAYVLLNKNAHPVTGLVYAWTNSEGKDPSDCYYEVSGSGTYNSYQYDACRTPWRITMDYVWYGTEDAHKWLQKINHFVQAPVYAQYDDAGRVWYGAGGIQNVVDSYWTNGLRRINPDEANWGHRHAIAFVGSFALASMASNQQSVDIAMAEFNSLEAKRYYESCLGMLYKLMATGNFWNPYSVR